MSIPQPAYPALAGFLGFSGYCEVRFSVTPQGLPTAIQPSCSRPTFCGNAARAIEEVRFSPAERGGQRVTRNNIIYPLSFLIEGHDEADVSALPLSDCIDPDMVASGTFTEGLGEEAQVSDTQPLVPPQPVYPLYAAERGLSGACDVRFDVGEDGHPRRVRPSCSHPAFCKSASKAMVSARFRPAQFDGKPFLRRNVVYPLEYAMQGMPRQPFDPRSFVPCAATAVQ
ncbi:MAG: energy transducer TonB [Thermaurantiacus sp.]